MFLLKDLEQDQPICSTSGQLLIMLTRDVLTTSMGAPFVEGSPFAVVVHKGKTKEQDIPFWETSRWSSSSQQWVCAK